MGPVSILLLAGIFFLLIAVVGGGFEIKEIKIPVVPRWARILSGLLGVIFCGLSVATFSSPTLPMGNNFPMKTENKILIFIS